MLRPFYLLTEQEIDHIIKEMQKGLKDSQLGDIFASKEREKYAKKLVMPYIKKTVDNREVISLPEANVVDGIYQILECE